MLLVGAPLALVIGLAGALWPSASIDAPRWVRQEHGAPARKHRMAPPLPPAVDAAETPQIADAAGGALEAFTLDVPSPDREPAAGHAALTPEELLAKLAAKLTAKQDKIAAKNLKIAELQQKLAASQLKLLAAYSLPAGTPAQLSKRKSAIKAAAAVVKKWQKKLNAAWSKLGELEDEVDSLIEQINAIDPNYLGPGEDDGEGEPGAQGNVTVPLVLQEALMEGAQGFERPLTVATFGIPFADSDEVPDNNGRPGLGIDGAGRWQLRTLSKWPSGFVQWALVDVQRSIPGNGMVTNLEITAGNGKSAQAAIASQVGSLIHLDTGAIQADVATTGFNLFDRVTVNGVDVVAPHASPGIVGSAQGQPLAAGPNTTVVIEENGPARAVVRADGTLRTLSGTDVVDFTCRMTARAGSNAVEVTFTVRNANIQRPAHVVLDGLELVVRAQPGTTPLARMSTHNGEHDLPVQPADSMILYQAYSSAPTQDVFGDGGGYLPPIAKVPSVDEFTKEGYSLTENGVVLHALGDRDEYPPFGWADLSGSLGGVTVGVKQMPYWWPASLGIFGSGDVAAGIFTLQNGTPYTFVWGQHESRTVAFAFHTGSALDPQKVARGLDAPVTGRAADYDQYDHAKVFPYRLVTLAEENEAYAAMGINHTVNIQDTKLSVTRFLAAHSTGGPNNHDSIEKQLVGEWLRHGHGGQYLNALDLALYKSEWQVVRSDNFDEKDNPGASNDAVPHSINFEEDYEHRYREGMIDAYYLTGDERIKAALMDEAENLRLLTLGPHERAMYQSLRAQATVGEFANDAVLKTKLKQRIQYFCTPLLDVSTGVNGMGWQALPLTGNRHYYAASAQNTDEKVPGENYVTRGFITASLGPIGMYQAARWLGESDPDGKLAHDRMVDLAYYTRGELFPWFANPADRHLVYAYGVATKQVITWELVDYHPILLGMAEAFLDTGDVTYLQKGIEQIQAFKAHDTGPYNDNLYLMDSRLDVQHFMAIYLDMVHAGQ